MAGHGMGVRHTKQCKTKIGSEDLKIKRSKNNMGGWLIGSVSMKEKENMCIKKSQFVASKLELS